jgi:hypothetical protein
MMRMHRDEEKQAFVCRSCGLETRRVNGEDMFDRTAPVPVAEVADTHRGWLIEENWLHQWEATHPGFDGPEDSRSVTGKTRTEVLEAIDEWIAEHGA